MLNRCPKCGFRQIDSDAIEYANLLWGSPIKRCKQCDHEYFDSRYHEAGLEMSLYLSNRINGKYSTYDDPYKEHGRRSKLLRHLWESVLACCIIAIVLSGPVCILVSLIMANWTPRVFTDNGLLYIGMVITIVLPVMLFRRTRSEKENERRFAMEKKRSYVRVQDEQYVKKLLELDLQYHRSQFGEK